MRCLFAIQEEIWDRLMSVEVRERAQTEHQHFRNHEHTVFKAMRLDEVMLGVSLDSEVENSKP